MLAGGILMEHQSPMQTTDMTGSTACAVLVPTYGRADRLAGFLADPAGLSSPHLSTYFIVEADDWDTRRVLSDHGQTVLVNEGAPSYACCVNFAFGRTTESFVYTGADDLYFTEGWFEQAAAYMCDPAIGVVGTHDPILNNRGHSTHFLVRRRYVNEHGGAFDMPGSVFYPYHHAWCDWELENVAKCRAAYAYARRSVVSHIHPGFDAEGRPLRESTLFDGTHEHGAKHHRQDTFDYLARRERWKHFLSDPIVEFELWCDRLAASDLHGQPRSEG